MSYVFSYLLLLTTPGLSGCISAAAVPNDHRLGGSESHLRFVGQKSDGFYWVKVRVQTGWVPLEILGENLFPNLLQLLAPPALLGSCPPSSTFTATGHVTLTSASPAISSLPLSFLPLFSLIRAIVITSVQITMMVSPSPDSQLSHTSKLPLAMQHIHSFRTVGYEHLWRLILPTYLSA